MTASANNGGERSAARLEGVAKRFGAIRALDDISLELRRGEIHALIGHNGAGKSTIVKILAGALAPDRGDVRIGGQALRPTPASALGLGVRCIFQQRTLFPNCSVAENIAAGSRRPGWYSEARSRRIARARLARLDCHIDESRLAETLSIGEAQEVDIARALDESCRLLILDEPTSSLPAREVTRLLEVMKQIRQLGVGLLFISHELEVVRRIADRVTILRDGKVAAAGPMTGFTKGALIDEMLGTESSQERGAAQSAVSAPARRLAPPERLVRMTATDLEGDTLGKTSIEIVGGEVLGVTGSLGSGVTELARLLSGVTRPRGGRLALNGADLRLRSPRQALKHGIAYLSDDRLGTGLFTNLLPYRQIGLSQIALRRQPVLDLREERRRALATAASVGLAKRDAVRPVTTLSGGNQQKVLIARCIAARPKVLIAHEPTVGVDVGSRAAIHGLLRGLAEEGVGVVVLSSDAEEIVEVADRALVLRLGAVVGDLRRFDEGQLIRESLGSDEPPTSMPAGGVEGR